MAKEELIEMEGEIILAHPNAYFTVKMDNGHEALCHASGKLRKYFIRVTVGDRVTIELSPYDLKRGRITFRNK